MSQQSTESREKERNKQQKKQDQKLREQKMREQKMREQKLHNQGSDARTRGQDMRDLGSSNNNNLGTDEPDMRKQRTPNPASPAKHPGFRRSTSGGANPQRPPIQTNRTMHLHKLEDYGLENYEDYSLLIFFRAGQKAAGKLQIKHTASNQAKYTFEITINANKDGQKVSITRSKLNKEASPDEVTVCDESKNSGLRNEIIKFIEQLEKIE